MVKKMKYLIIILIILIIIISICLIFLLQNKDSTENKNIIGNEDYVSNISDKETGIDEEEIKILKDRNEFFTAASCVDTYLGYLSKSDSEILYELIDKSYIKEKNITKDNILTQLENVREYNQFYPKIIYCKTNQETLITSYYIIGQIEKVSLDENEPREEYYITINMDKNNGTFSVIPGKEMFQEINISE